MLSVTGDWYLANRHPTLADDAQGVSYFALFWPLSFIVKNDFNLLRASTSGHACVSTAQTQNRFHRVSRSRLKTSGSLSCPKQAKSAEVSAAKRRSREQDLEPTERDFDGNDAADADAGEGGDGENGGSAAGRSKGGGGKKRQRAAAAAAAESGARGEDLDRLKKGFLGGSQMGGRAKPGGASLERAPAALASSAEDFVQPKKKKKAIKGPS